MYGRGNEEERQRKAKTEKIERRQQLRKFIAKHSLPEVFALERKGLLSPSRPST